MSDNTNENKVNVKKEILEWIVSLLIAVVIALLIRYFIFTPTLVMQTSMYPTLKEGERLYLSRMIRNFDELPQRGDIITFEQPDAIATSVDNPVAYYNEHPGLTDKFVRYFLEIGKRSFIKRVIALPGEHVKIEDGKVYINGEVLDEPYLQEGLETTNLDGEFYDLIVPQGCIFAMGDNRSGSKDCREFGCIPVEKIEGKVLFRIWPLNSFGAIDKEE